RPGPPSRRRSPKITCARAPTVHRVEKYQPKLMTVNSSRMSQSPRVTRNRVSSARLRRVPAIHALAPATLVARSWALLGSGGRDGAVEAARRAIALLEATRSGERWRGYWVLGTALAERSDAEAARDALRRAIALVATIRDELPADDAVRRAGVTRARAAPARA